VLTQLDDVAATAGEENNALNAAPGKKKATGKKAGTRGTKKSTPAKGKAKPAAGKSG
jgi:hypothetical protein